MHSGPAGDSLVDVGSTFVVMFPRPDQKTGRADVTQSDRHAHAWVHGRTTAVAAVGAASLCVLPPDPTLRLDGRAVGATMARGQKKTDDASGAHATRHLLRQP